MRVGSRTTRLIVLRGNSASGKTTVAQQVRDRCGPGVALVGQDTIRRTILQDKDVPGTAAVGLIDAVARYALDHGYHVVVEGILSAARYGAMLQALRRDHIGPSRFYYLETSFAETLRRHATRPQAADFGEREMRGWYKPLDLLDDRCEEVIGQESPLEATVRRVLEDTGLLPRQRATPTASAGQTPTIPDGS
ncbi:AAA family ATPase [Streptomyces sp. NPDC054933]